MTTSRICALLLLLVTAPAVAQVTTIESNNPLPKGQDLNRIVCEEFETTGTRLGARKVCKTVLEWQQLTSEQRQAVEQVQRMNTSVGCQEGQPCPK